MHPMAVGTINLILYFAAVVIVVFSARLAFPIPDEVFRKILHFILLGSFYVLVVSYPVWWQAALVRRQNRRRAGARIREANV